MKSLNLAYNPRIDQLRWLAATLVFCFHFYLEYRGLGGAPLLSQARFGLMSQGLTGVGLFFTLSGFLFMQIAQRQRAIVYREFLRNRLLRIVPLYLTIFLLATSIGRDRFQPQDILYLLTSNLGMPPTSGSVVTGAAWSISLEFLFYMVFPFLARFALEQGPGYLVKLLAMMLFFKLAAYSVNQKSELMYFSTFVGRFDQFLIGMLAAMLFDRHSIALKRRVWPLPAAVVLVYANSVAQAHYAPFNPALKSVYWIFWSMQESGGWACLIVGWLAYPKQLLPVWLERVLTHGGKISFSFYLLHMALIHVLAQGFGLQVIFGNVWGDAAIMLLLTYGATWALATLSFGVLEQPFLGMRSRYGATALTLAEMPARQSGG